MIFAFSLAEIVEIEGRRAAYHREWRARRWTDVRQYAGGMLCAHDLEAARQDEISPRLMALGRPVKLDPPRPICCQWITALPEPFGLPIFCGAPIDCGAWCAERAPRVFAAAADASD